MKRKRKELDRKSRLYRNLEIVELRTKGLSLREIGDRFDLSEARVCQILKRFA
jgi:DNA-directed RNA polymerase specialized sigma subunit